MYIDGVFSGGGIKGFALVGAYQAIEEGGFKFKRVAGTSAGSIIGALVIAGYTSQEIHNLLDELDVKKLLDERSYGIPIPFAKWFFLYWKLGLYKGKYLETWLEEKLAAKGIRTFKDLPFNSLRLIASDLTNGRMLVLPNDLENYGIPWWSFSVAKAIRMSCSLPFFFEPVKLRTRVGTDLIVDGGVLSNFPMWLFDRENVKTVRPVLGIKLSSSYQEHERHEITNGIQMLEALFETMKDAHDARYISRKHEKNIIFIPPKGILSTEFHLTEEDKHALILHGKETAEKFLKSWSY